MIDNARKIIDAGQQFAAANGLPTDPSLEHITHDEGERDEAMAESERQKQILTELLAPRRFDPANPPPPVAPIYWLNDTVIATPGNLMAVQAQAKSGKTAIASAMQGAALGGKGDCLGVRSENPHQHAVIVFDTEQSEHDHFKVSSTAIRRAESGDMPTWFRSYSLVGFSLDTLRKLIRHELEAATEEHGGVHSLFLDGIADFVADPNDPEEANGFIAELHGLADEFKTLIVCVLHENPGSEGGKTRGHLGSQLERKAETNLRLSKEDEIITAFTERARSASIPKDRGARFQWSDEAKMHVTADAAEIKEGDKAAKRKNDQVAAAKYALAKCFAKTSQWRLSGLQVACRPMPEKTVESYFYALRNVGLLLKTAVYGLYEIAPTWESELKAMGLKQEDQNHAE